MSAHRSLGSYFPELGSFHPVDAAGVGRPLDDVLARGYVDCGTHGRKPITGGVTVVEAQRLADIIVERRCSSCAETGVAFGISTAAVCLALKKLGVEGANHYGVDPCQWKEHGGAAIHLLRELGAEEPFELLESPAHEGLAELLRRGVRLDFAFIDGWHTLDYKLLDFFYFDKLLRPGGIMAMHDGLFRSTRSVLTYCFAYRNYRLLPYPKVSAIRTVQRLGHWFARRANYVQYTLQRLPNLLILEKVSDAEPNFDFYRSF